MRTGVPAMPCFGRAGPLTLELCGHSGSTLPRRTTSPPWSYARQNPALSQWKGTSETAYASANWRSRFLGQAFIWAPPPSQTGLWQSRGLTEISTHL